MDGVQAGRTAGDVAGMRNLFFAFIIVGSGAMGWSLGFLLRTCIS